MKFTEKVRRRLRNVFITLTIICLTPLCEVGRPLSGAQQVDAFTGEELLCVIDLKNEMYNSAGLATGLTYKLVNLFATDNNCSVTVITAKENTDYCDSLRQGKIDLLITDRSGTEDLDVLFSIAENSSWVMNCADRQARRSPQKECMS